MTATQPQLLKLSIIPGDVIFTCDLLAQDIVSCFSFSGRILEPCSGDGAFLKYLPTYTDWCEINKGRDFFQWHERVDWIVGNPPYSTKVFLKWLSHSFELADNVVYILPINKIFQSWKVMDMIEKYGGIRNILAYGRGGSVGFPFGFSVGAFHFARGWKGDTRISMRKLKNAL